MKTKHHNRLSHLIGYSSCLRVEWGTGWPKSNCWIPILCKHMMWLRNRTILKPNKRKMFKRSINLFIILEFIWIILYHNWIFMNLCFWIWNPYWWNYQLSKTPAISLMIQSFLLLNITHSEVSLDTPSLPFVSNFFLEICHQFFQLWVHLLGGWKPVLPTFKRFTLAK